MIFLTHREEGIVREKSEKNITDWKLMHLSLNYGHKYNLYLFVNVLQTHIKMLK